MDNHQNILTRELSQTEIVILAVYLLNGDQCAVDTEDAALKAHEIAPGRFAWRKYQDRINLELVRVYLSDAKKPKNGEMLSGSGRTGWKLTQAGFRWAMEAIKLIGKTDLSRSREQLRSGSIDEQHWRRERARILNTSAWRRWENGDRSIPLREAREVFRIDSYAVGGLKESKIIRVRSLFAEDDDFNPFLTRLANIINNAGD